MKYKIGDKVKIREKVADGGYFPVGQTSLNVNNTMMRLAGRIATITAYDKGRNGLHWFDDYHIDLDDGHWHWVDSMFEPAFPKMACNSLL